MCFVMSRESFYVVYDGPALVDSEMDAKFLAPALLALSEAIEEANNIFNGTKANAKLKVNASFKSGCFGIELSMLVSFWDKTKHIFSEVTLADAKNILEWIGLITGQGSIIGASVFGLIKWVNGRKITKIEPIYDSGICKVYIGSDCLEVEERVIELYRDIKFRKAVIGMLSPLKQDGINEFAVTNSLQSEKFTVVTKNEVERFELPEEEDPLSDSVYETNLQIVGLSFEENNKWKFSDGNGLFNASILDEDFISEIDAGVLSFSKGDVISATVRQIQTMKNGKIKSEYQLLKVNKIIPGLQQVKLSFDE
ncbi:MAG: hypothetical protein GX667_09320 [Xanthomonadaceae bacterium]|nr:hypothetical protein [Xanthomonadaceae bacterium]